MKVGMIVHSETGHTLGIARAIEKALKADGYEVQLECVVAKSKKPWKAQIPELQEVPDPHGFDLLVLGAPAWGFTLSHVMREYLYKVAPLEAHKLVLFSTGALHRFLGSKWAMKKMASLSEMPESKIVFAGTVRFPRTNKPRHFDEVVNRVVTTLKDAS